MDIVEELRAQYSTYRAHIGLDAADEIERLKANFQALCDENEQQIEQNCELRVEIERLSNSDVPSADQCQHTFPPQKFGAPPRTCLLCGDRER